MNIINNIKYIQDNFGSVDLSAINCLPGQNYVLDLKTTEPVTVFNCFRERQQGQSWGVLLKAIQLCNLKNKKTIVVYERLGSFRYLIDSLDSILKTCNTSNEEIITKKVKQNKSATIEFENNSVIEIIHAGQIPSRNSKVDYVLVDDADLTNVSLLKNISNIAKSKNGQVFIFPRKL